MACVAAALLATSCAKNATYQKQDYSAAAVAGQYVTTLPKMDILVFQDNSMSMTTPMGILQPELVSFVNSIAGNWDVHFTVVPLQATMSLYSKYIIASDCSTISGGTCLTPSQAATFNSTSNNEGWIQSINQAIGNTDLGFANIVAEMNNSASGIVSTGFLRNDAPLAIVVLSNGEDISGGVGYTQRADGLTIIDYTSSTTINSFNNYKNAIYSTIQSLKNSSSTFYSNNVFMQFYSVVAANQNENCYGTYSFIGQRYIWMSSALNSNYYDLCAGGGLQNVLNNISSQMKVNVQTVLFNYAVLADAPIVSSIVVTKNGQTIPQSSSNGWSYVGYETNAYTSYYPQNGNPQTGYFIKLNGSAVYSGSDVINVDYQKQ